MTEYCVGFSVLYSRYLLTNHSTYLSVNMPVPKHQFYSAQTIFHLIANYEKIAKIATSFVFYNAN